MLAPVASGPISSNPVLASDGQKRVSDEDVFLVARIRLRIHGCLFCIFLSLL